MHEGSVAPLRRSAYRLYVFHRVALIAGLPYLNPWQLPGRGMRAFRLAREATLRALDSPMVGPGVATPPVPARADGSTNFSSGGDGGDGGGSRFSPKSGKEGVRVVKIQAQNDKARPGVGGEGLARSRL